MIDAIQEHPFCEMETPDSEIVVNPMQIQLEDKCRMHRGELGNDLELHQSTMLVPPISNIVDS